MRDYAQMLGIELIVIDSKTEVNELRKELRWNEAYYTLKQRR
jgi:L-arabinose isomerase